MHIESRSTEMSGTGCPRCSSRRRTRPGGRAARAVWGGSFRGRTRPLVPPRAAGAFWCVGSRGTPPLWSVRAPGRLLENRGILRTPSRLLRLDLAGLRPCTLAQSTEYVSAVQSSASLDPVSPVDRELDRFPFLLRSDREARLEHSNSSSCRLPAARARSLGLGERASSGTRRADSCVPRRARPRERDEQS